MDERNGKLFKVEREMCFDIEKPYDDLVATDAFFDALESARDDVELLELSLAKWRYIVRWLKAHRGRKLFDGGAQTCARCGAYWNGKCKGCPIAADRDQGCIGTPYQNYTTTQVPDARLRYAEFEVAYLEGLLEKMKEEDERCGN